MGASNESDATKSVELLRRAAAGDETAETEIFERYVQRLTALARSRLATKLAARVDAEDIVMSAYRSFFMAARDGRFELHRGGDLWRLLVELTLHKLYRTAHYHLAQQRSVEREQPSDNDSGQFRILAGHEPTPQEALAAAEELEAVLGKLDARDRQAIELRLQGYELAEIAEQLHCHERTVRRAVNAARRIITARGGGNFVPSAARQRPKFSAVESPLGNRIEISTADAPLQWSEYVLHEQIGIGAMGRVYRATRKTDGQEFAIKFLRKSLTQNDSALRRFLAEAKIVAELSHPAIVAIHGAGQTPGGGLFLLMDQVVGADLHRIRNERPPSLGEAIDWIAAAADAVDFAHAQGVIHCDLKPSNLLLSATGQIRVTDFGFAVRLAENSSRGLSLAGTPAFMAPEQADSSWGPISPRTDVWGLGAVLYFLLYGRPPHEGPDVAATLTGVSSRQPVSFPDDRKPNVSVQLRDIVERCLRKPPEERIVSAAFLAERLRQVRT